MFYIIANSTQITTVFSVIVSKLQTRREPLEWAVSDIHRGQLANCTAKFGMHIGRFCVGRNQYVFSMILPKMIAPACALRLHFRFPKSSPPVHGLWVYQSSARTAGGMMTGVTKTNRSILESPDALDISITCSSGSASILYSSKCGVSPCF